MIANTITAMAAQPGKPRPLSQATGGTQISAMKMDNRKGTNSDAAAFIPATTTMKAAV
jgi:hypothetical protein